MVEFSKRDRDNSEQRGNKVGVERGASFYGVNHPTPPTTLRTATASEREHDSTDPYTVHN